MVPVPSATAPKTQFCEIVQMSQDVISYNLTSKAIARTAVASSSDQTDELSWTTAEFKLSTTLLNWQTNVLTIR